jgi:hypothetical protein
MWACTANLVVHNPFATSPVFLGYLIQRQFARLVVYAHKSYIMSYSHCSISPLIMKPCHPFPCRLSSPRRPPCSRVPIIPRRLAVISTIYAGPRLILIPSEFVFIPPAIPPIPGSSISPAAFPPVIDAPIRSPFLFPVLAVVLFVLIFILPLLRAPVQSALNGEDERRAEQRERDSVGPVESLALLLRLFADCSVVRVGVPWERVWRAEVVRHFWCFVGLITVVVGFVALWA